MDSQARATNSANESTLNQPLHVRDTASSEQLVNLVQRLSSSNNERFDATAAVINFLDEEAESALVEEQVETPEDTRRSIT